jgi:hypothetical protein
VKGSPPATASPDNGEMTTGRRIRFDAMSAFLASHSDTDLSALVDGAPPGEVGVGGGSAMAVADGVPVFVKRIPLSDLELARPRDTANLFDLPLFCQYGIGGPGFGAWRELAANLTVTEAVLAGETRSFPLLFHWRVLPGRPAIPAEHADIDAAVARMGDNAAVRTRLEALATASHSLMLFFEHLPLPLLSWLREDPAARAEPLERQLFELVTFLRDADLLHMDGHFGNARTDGEQIYLTDFGLATSTRFDLSDGERDFVARHLTHDAGYAAMQLVNWLATIACEIPAPGGTLARNEFVRRCAAGSIPGGTPPAVAEILGRHAPAAARMNDFYWQLFGGDVGAEYPG